MGREVRRVPLDFDWPLNEVWKGLIMPDKFEENDCPDCELGYGPEAYHMYLQWYGNTAFSPEEKGSTPLTKDTPVVRAFAERNVAHSPEYYGTGEYVIQREAHRLASIWNEQWGHHLSQEEVDYLVNDDENGGIRHLSHVWNKETKSYERIERDKITAEEVNIWSIDSFFNTIPWHRLVEWHCERMGVSYKCLTCDGHGSLEAYPGQREEAEKWKWTYPEEGDGWQLWETVSEGSPITPVFESAEGLAHYLYSQQYTRDSFASYENALNFVKAGWAPSGVVSNGQFMTGAEFVGSTSTEGDS